MYSLNYVASMENHVQILQYCLKYSDSFSVITNLKKPYNKTPPNLEHDNTLSKWHPFLVNQVIGIKEWPGTVTRDNHKVMNVYDSHAFRKANFLIPNLFELDLAIPQDICFYRQGHAWFVTVTHEQIVYLLSATPRDIEFFINLGLLHVK